jgi:hypothetical protein
MAASLAARAARDITSPLRSAPPRAIVLPTSSMEGEVVMRPIHIRFALFAFGTAVLSSGLACHGARATEHTLMPSPQTVHIGYFSAALKPVLTVNSGDIVTIESVGGPDPANIEASGVISPSAIPDYVRTIRREVTDRGPGQTARRRNLNCAPRQRRQGAPKSNSACK